MILIGLICMASMIHLSCTREMHMPELLWDRPGVVCCVTTCVSRCCGPGPGQCRYAPAAYKCAHGIRLHPGTHGQAKQPRAAGSRGCGSHCLGHRTSRACCKGRCNGACESTIDYAIDCETPAKCRTTTALSQMICTKLNYFALTH